MEQFEIDGCKFWFSGLSFEDGCKGARLVAEAAGPGLAASKVSEAIGAGLAASIDRLPALVRLFATNAEFQSPSPSGPGAGRRVPLSKFVDDVFRGKLDHAILFVTNCAVTEYAHYFLGTRADALGEAFAQLLERSPALKALIHSSGDSSSADTSKTD